MIDTVVLPGDRFEVEDDGSHIVVGPGLRRGIDSENELIVCKCGILRRKNSAYWVDNHQKRYIPSKSENVIGVVTRKAGDLFRVDIGSSEPASLSYLAFEGATKKNRPNVQIGDIVYAKLLLASKDMEPELVCVDSYGKRAGLGVLSGGGFVFTVPMHLIRKLLSRDSILLDTLGKTIPFEIAVGMNGRIWIRGKSVKETICLINAIWVSEHMNNDEIKAMCSKLVDALAGF